MKRRNIRRVSISNSCDLPRISVPLHFEFDESVKAADTPVLSVDRRDSHVCERSAFGANCRLVYVNVQRHRRAYGPEARIRYGARVAQSNRKQLARGEGQHQARLKGGAVHSNSRKLLAVQEKAHGLTSRVDMYCQLLPWTPVPMIGFSWVAPVIDDFGAGAVGRRRHADRKLKRTRSPEDFT
eukprot:6195890-Pleurochrysis_carterae.AAC.2